MRRSCEKCVGTGLTVYGRAIQDGRATRRDYGSELLFCPACKGHGTTGTRWDTIGDLLIAALIVGGTIGFWATVLWLVLR